jgi:hypothetical protein
VLPGQSYITHEGEVMDEYEEIVEGLAEEKKLTPEIIHPP